MFYSKNLDIYGGQTSTQIPAFSKILNIIPDQYNVEIIYELDPYQDSLDTSKSLFIRIEEDMILEYSAINQSASNFKYWNTYKISNPLIDKIDDKIGISSLVKTIHVFYDEIEPIIEVRDRKINNILN